MTQTPNSPDYRTRIVSSLSEVGQPAWDALVQAQPDANPFLSFAFLHALHESGSASDEKGWQPQYLTLWREQALVAALPMYAKFHSYGEYVFDWAWADAYRRNGLDYYPKLLSAIPFTPVTGARLMAVDADARTALIGALKEVQRNSNLSSTHVLYPPEAEAQQLAAAGFMLRKGVQFHWQNQGYESFEQFLSSLEQKKRKNIRAERRKVHDAGITLRQVMGRDASDTDWRFFKSCYDQTYREHYSTPYLNLDFFLRIGETMPDNILLVIAERDGLPIASSLLIYDQNALYGRYWGVSSSTLACISRPRITSPWSFVSRTVLPHLKAALRANTKWHAAFYRSKLGPPTGWRILRSQMRWSAFYVRKARAWRRMSAN
jgi:uncharacterized protein